MNSTDYSTIVQLLHDRASRQPNQMAYTFLRDGATPSESLTYQELDRKARAIAASLQSLVSPGDKVLLVYPQSLEFLEAFCGCLYAGVIAVPTPAPEALRLKRILPRLKAIAQDAQATLVLTTSSLISQLEVAQLAIEWLATDTVQLQADTWVAPKISSDILAYLQYTSGSTSTPKGVMITHRNLMDNLACIHQAHGYNSESICATWIPYFHDYGLVNGLIQPLYAGIQCYVMSPITFIKRPIRWLQTISRYQVTHSGAPNFAYDYCVRKSTPAQRHDLNLSSWYVAHSGAEPIRPETLSQFAETFKPCGFHSRAFYPSYGLAEATLMVTTRRQIDVPSFCTVSRDALAENRILETHVGLTEILPGVQTQLTIQNLVTLTGCGYPFGDTRVVIVCPDTLTPCGTNKVGEIWVSSSSVAQGYWQRLEETNQTFQAHLVDSDSGLFLRTGDLGFLRDGELFVTGRLKDVIIVRGSNYYPQDIELAVQQSHPALRPGCGAAFSVDNNSQERVVIVQEVERSYYHLEIDEIFGEIRRAIAAKHELELYAVVLLKQGSIPKTSSGKIMRHACRAKFLDGMDVLASDIKNSEFSVKPATPIAKSRHIKELKD